MGRAYNKKMRATCVRFLKQQHHPSSPHSFYFPPPCKARADANKATTDNGSTPTFIAAENGHAKALKVLLEAQPAAGGQGLVVGLHVFHRGRDRVCVQWIG